MVWEGEKSHRKLISRKKNFFASLWWKYFFGVGVDQKWKKKFFAGNWLGGREKSSKVDFEKKKFFCLSVVKIFFRGGGWPKMKKKNFLLEIVWEGEKSHWKLILRKKKFASLWWKYFFGVGVDQKWKKKFFCWKWSGRARKLIESWFWQKKNFFALKGEAKSQKERPKANREAEGLPPAFRRN